jgi:competence protein ComEA
VDVLARYRGYLVIGLLNLAALGGAVWQVRDPRESAVFVVPAPSETPAPTPTEARLRVYVSGAVARPDVVALPPGARAVDAVAAAGGWSEAADRAAVNLAAPLVDGQQLHVPAVGEAPPPSVGHAPPAGSAGQAAGVVDVNTASAAEFEALPGIGPALAERIVDDRTANGPFRSPEDLGRVSGIGDKTLQGLLDRVVVR